MSFSRAAAPIAYQLPLSYETVAPQPPVEDIEVRYSLRTRTALIAGAGAGLWGVILCAGYFVATALI